MKLSDHVSYYLTIPACAYAAVVLYPLGWQAWIWPLCTAAWCHWERSAARKADHLARMMTIATQVLSRMPGGIPLAMQTLDAVTAEIKAK